MRSRLRNLSFVAMGIAAFFIGDHVDELRVTQGMMVIYTVVAICSLVLLTGYSGQISMGHGALMAVGAYSAVLSRTYWHFPLAATFAIAVLGAAIFGALLGVAAGRLKGPYLAGTTLALAFGLPFITSQFSFLKGTQGLPYDLGNAPKSFRDNATEYKWYFWIAALAGLIIIWLLSNLLSSRYGRQWRALRSAPVSAELSGIHIGRSKVLAFTISSGIAGLAGAILAMSVKSAFPDAFPLVLSFTILTGVVLAGTTSLAGALIAGLLLVAIKEDLSGRVTDYFASGPHISDNLPVSITSFLLIVTVLFAPNGPKFRKK